MGGPDKAICPTCGQRWSGQLDRAKAVRADIVRWATKNDVRISAGERLRISDAARYADLAPKTLRNWACADPPLPTHKSAGRSYVTLAEFAEYLVRVKNFYSRDFPQ